jgi:hypothetical protein
VEAGRLAAPVLDRNRDRHMAPLCELDRVADEFITI